MQIPWFWSHAAIESRGYDKGWRAGKGYYSYGGGEKDRCFDCLGTGKELTLREREMVEAMLQAIDVRERIGRG